MDIYLSAQGKQFRERENLKHNRGHDPADELTPDESAVVLAIVQVEAGTVSGDLLSDEMADVVRWHLSHSPTETGGD
jgi:hypothetical protein